MQFCPQQCFGIVAGSGYHAISWYWGCMESQLHELSWKWWCKSWTSIFYPWWDAPTFVQRWFSCPIPWWITNKNEWNEITRSASYNSCRTTPSQKSIFGSLFREKKRQVLSSTDPCQNSQHTCNSHVCVQSSAQTNRLE